MKKNIVYISLLLLITACSNNQPAPPETPTTTSSASDLMKEGPAYDPSKIDAAAPVTELVLKATGNTMADMSYDLKELRVKAGSTVHLQLMNTCTDAAMVHNFVLIEEGTADKVGPEGMKAGAANNFIPKMKQVLVATNMTQPGTRTEITFPAPEKGTYDYICTYPGHYQKMNGKFIVE